MGRDGFRGAAQREAAESAVAVGAKDDYIRGPVGGFLQDDLFRAGDENGKVIIPSIQVVQLGNARETIAS